MSIPKNFQLFGTTVTVTLNNTYCNSKNVYGEASYTESLIILSDTDGLDKLSYDTKMNTFYHEKVHMILDTMGEHEKSSDEKFVDIFAKLLRQADESAQY